MTETNSAIRMLSLRAQLERRNEEKSSVLAEITSTTAAPRRKQEAVRRYTSLTADIRRLTKELEALYGF